MSHNLHWQPLSPGDIIDVIAPASALEQGQEGIGRIVGYLQENGLQARIPRGILGKDLLCAHTPAHRFQHLQQALAAPDSKAVWCIKGGYGAAHILPMLREEKPPRKSKLLIGFSDITALHLFLNQTWQWPTLHAPMLGQIINGKIKLSALRTLHKMLSGTSRHITHTLTPLNTTAAKLRRPLKGSVIGGNLSLVQCSIGTFWQARTKEKFLFLEDVDEDTRRLHRMLTHLDQARLLTSVKALLLGDFSRVTKKAGYPPLDDMLRHFAAHFSASASVPVFRLRHVGHESMNRPLPLNTPATIEADGRFMLTITSGADL